LVLLHLKS